MKHTFQSLYSSSQCDEMNNIGELTVASSVIDNAYCAVELNGLPTDWA